MSLDELVIRIRSDCGESADQIPGFDPANGNENARYLLLLESPGPKAVESGIVSISNNDPTAKNLSSQLAKAAINQTDIVIWNVIPWKLSGDSGTIRPAKEEDFSKGQIYLEPLIDELPNLKCIVLVGASARRVHVYLSSFAKVPILSCHHTSSQSMNNGKDRMGENIRVFEFMRNNF